VGGGGGSAGGESLGLGGRRVCIVGAGPAGLRTAVELALLGASVCVVEAAQDVTSMAQLRLWGCVVHDLLALGLQALGYVSVDNIDCGNDDASVENTLSVAALQLLLLKVALLLGVEVAHGTHYVGLVRMPPLVQPLTQPSAGRQPKDIAPVGRWALQLRSDAGPDGDIRSPAQREMAAVVIRLLTQAPAMPGSCNNPGVREEVLYRGSLSGVAVGGGWYSAAWPGAGVDGLWALIGAHGSADLLAPPSAMPTAEAPTDDGDVSHAVVDAASLSSQQRDLLPSPQPNARSLAGWNAWDRPLLRWPCLADPALDGALRCFFELAMVPPIVANTLGLGWEFPRERGGTSLQEQEPMTPDVMAPLSPPIPLLFEPVEFARVRDRCGLALASVGMCSGEAHAWLAAPQLESLLGTGVLRHLDVPEDTVLALVRETEPALFDLILACRGFSIAESARSRRAEAVKTAEREPQLEVEPLLAWAMPAAVAALIFQRSESVLRMDATRRSTSAIVERLLLNLGHPEPLRGAARLGGRGGAAAGEGYRRLAAAARELLQDWRRAHAEQLAALQPPPLRVAAKPGMDGGEEKLALATSSVGRATIVRYAVDRTQLAAAARRVAAYWRPACTQPARSSPPTVGEGGERYPLAREDGRSGRWAVRLGGDGHGGLAATRAATVLMEEPAVCGSGGGGSGGDSRWDGAMPPLVLSLVGDALLPAVWAEGTAANRGMLLSALDCAWLLVRAAGLREQLGVHRESTAQVLNERERLYRLRPRPRRAPINCAVSCERDGDWRG
jgi:hypothetical protein